MSETPDKPVVRDPDFLPPGAALADDTCPIHMGQVCDCSTRDVATRLAFPAPDMRKVNGSPVQEAVKALDALDGRDYDKDHHRADKIVLGVADPEVRAAYERLVKRAAPHWYYA